MTFGEQILATLIGTFFGFVGALTLFCIKEIIQSYKKNNAIKDNLLYELKYNIILFGKYEADLTKCIEAVSNDSRNVYATIDYEKVASYFAIQFYREGLIKKYFHPEDVKRWNDFLVTVREGLEAYVDEKLEKWRKSEIDKEEIFSALNRERNHIRHAKEMSEYIKGKIE